MDSRVDSVFSEEPEDTFELAKGFKLSPSQIAIMDANSLIDRAQVTQIIKRANKDAKHE